MVAFGALEGRIDPNFYRVDFQEIVKKITKNNSKKLSYLVHFSSETWNGKDFFEKEFPYIEISEINLLSGKINHISNVSVKEAPSRAKMIVRNDDIIVSTTRPSRGAISHIELENNVIQIASTGFSVLRNLKTDLILKDYLFYCLRQEFSLKQMEQRSSGGNYPAITTEELKNLLIPIPDLETQTQIVSIFEKAYTQKKAQEQQAKQLLAGIDAYLLEKLGIMDSRNSTSERSGISEKRHFFVNFSQVQGKRFDPFYHQTEFEEKLKSIEKGKYATTSIKKVLKSFKKGIEVGSNSYIDLGIPFIRVSDITNFGLDYENADKKISVELYETLKAVYQPQTNEILYSKDGTIGFCCVLDEVKECITSGGILRLQPNKELVNTHYLAYILSCNLFKELAERISIGAVIKHLTMEDWLKIPIPLPPLEVQQQIADHISALRSEAKLLQENAKLGIEKAKTEVEKMILG